jgi:molybdate transport system substrate-binding protein
MDVTFQIQSPPRRQFAARVNRLAIASLFALALGTTAASAADLKVVATPDMAAVLTSLAPQLEEITEGAVVIEAVSPAAVKKRLSVEPFDVAIVSENVAKSLRKRGKLAPNGWSFVALVGDGVAVPASAPRPDIGTVAGLRQAFLAARKIAFTGDDASGAHLRRVLARLEIADQVEARLTDTGSANPLESLIDGDSDLAVAPLSEIAAMPAVQSAGPLPWEVQRLMPVVGAIGAETAAPEAARRLIGFLCSWDAIKAIHAHGMDTALSE